MNWNTKEKPSDRYIYYIRNGLGGRGGGLMLSWDVVTSLASHCLGSMERDAGAKRPPDWGGKKRKIKVERERDGPIVYNVKLRYDGVDAN
jgi:hypothetical protein